MAGNDAVVQADHVIRHGPSKLSLDAGLRAQVPYPQGPVVAGADKLLAVAVEKFSGDDLLRVAGEGVAQLLVFDRPHPAGKVSIGGRQQVDASRVVVNGHDGAVAPA